jgi:hypothetical protein
MTRDTRRDLAACFVWKQVALGFPKTGVGAMADGARGTITDVTSGSS